MTRYRIVEYENGEFGVEEPYNKISWHGAPTEVWVEVSKRRYKTELEARDFVASKTVKRVVE